MILIGYRFGTAKKIKFLGISDDRADQKMGQTMIIRLGFQEQT